MNLTSLKFFLYFEAVFFPQNSRNSDSLANFYETNFAFLVYTQTLKYLLLILIPASMLLPGLSQRYM